MKNNFAIYANQTLSSSKETYSTEHDRKHQYNFKILKVNKYEEY